MNRDEALEMLIAVIEERELGQEFEPDSKPARALALLKSDKWSDTEPDAMSIPTGVEPPVAHDKDGQPIEPIYMIIAGTIPGGVNDGPPDAWNVTLPPPASFTLPPYAGVERRLSMTSILMVGWSPGALAFAYGRMIRNAAQGHVAARLRAMQAFVQPNPPGTQA